MAWVFFVVAGLFEIVWALGLKYTEGLTQLWPSVGTLLAMAISFFLLSLAMKTLPAGTSYGAWVGVGMVGTVLLGVLVLGEPATPLRLLSLALIVLGLVGLKLSTPAGSA